jgi:hypothetical protein
VPVAQLLSKGVGQASVITEKCTQRQKKISNGLSNRRQDLTTGWNKQKAKGGPKWSQKASTTCLRNKNSKL